MSLVRKMRMTGKRSEDGKGEAAVDRKKSETVRGKPKMVSRRSKEDSDV